MPRRIYASCDPPLLAHVRDLFQLIKGRGRLYLSTKEAAKVIQRFQHKGDL